MAAIDAADARAIGDEEDLARVFGVGIVDVFPDFDIPLGAQDDCAAVAPNGESVGREPIDAAIALRARV